MDAQRRLATRAWVTLTMVVGAGATLGCGGGRIDAESWARRSPVEQVGAMLKVYRQGNLKPVAGPNAGRGKGQARSKVAAADRDLPVYRPGPVPPPRGLRDLQPMARGYPLAVNALKDGQVRLFWNTDLAPDDTSVASVVLAYARDVPEKGGEVLMRDGSLKTLTAAQFQAATKPPGATVENAPAKPGR